MAQRYSNNLWHETQTKLRKVLLEEKKLEIGTQQQQQDREKEKWLIGHMLMKYINIVNKLDECYDLTIHPQQRELIGRVLDMALGRLLEIKKDIVELEEDEYVYLDEILAELKLTKEETEVRVPQNYWREREKAVDYRRELVKQAIQEVQEREFKEKYLREVPTEEREKVWAEYEAEQERVKLEKDRQKALMKKRLGLSVTPPPEPELQPGEMSLDKAVLIIQRHERARQGRWRIPLVRLDRKVRKVGQRIHRIPEPVAEPAARIIQKHWRKHRIRVLEKHREEQQLLFLNMLEPSWQEEGMQGAVQEIQNQRRRLQVDRQSEYESAQTKMTAEVARLHGAQMAEDTGDEIRYWLMNFYEKTGTMPKYPGPVAVLPRGGILGVPKGINREFINKEFEGQTETAVPTTQLGLDLSGLEKLEGTALVVAEHWITPEQYNTCKKESDRLKTKKKEMKTSKKEDSSDGKKKIKEKNTKTVGQHFQMTPSNFIGPLGKADKDYETMCQYADERTNLDQRYIESMIHDQKCHQLGMQVRKAVDELMRLELELLQKALQKDRKRKKKGKKKKGKKTGKMKKKRRKGKILKDLTADKTTEELFKELYLKGIIKDYEEVRLTNWIGERSLRGYEVRAMGEEPTPDSGDVRDVILQYCILPLGSAKVHHLAPHVKSVCLVGPQQGGKEYLTEIICTETGAVLFDLTSSNIRDKYPGKDGLRMLRHLVEKMSRALQPSVICVRDTEKTFYKKVPREERKDNPKRLQRILPKIVKGLTVEDQVLVLGTSCQPWRCARKKLRKSYQHFLYVPLPGYDTYFKLWKDLLLPYHSLPREFDFSALAKISTGHSVATITNVVKTVLSAERVCRSRVQPYQELDFATALSKIHPLTRKMGNKYLAFMRQTPLGKKRTQRRREMKEAEEKDRARKK